MSLASWKFKDPPNVAVFTTRQVVRDGVPVLYVSHDPDDGAWQFHSVSLPEPEDAMVVSLRSMLDRDPTLAEVGDLPMGWIAERAHSTAAWKRSKQPGAS